MERKENDNIETILYQSCLKNQKNINEYNNIKKNYFSSNKNKIKLIISLYVILNLIIFINNNIQNNIYSNNITLKINSSGYHNILGFIEFDSDYIEYFDPIYYPNEVYINGEKQNNITYKYYFNETDNFIELIWNNNIKSAENMFYFCEDITEIDLSNFNTSEVEDMSFMFSSCTSLTSLNLSYFDTSKVKDMVGMFCNCISMTSLDLSYFDTSKVVSMRMMFENCISLTSLDLSNFNTPIVILMDYMFNDCISLTNLDISNFNISKVREIDRMFQNCESLISLNLSNFYSSKVESVDYMFYNCKSLTLLDLSHFDTSNVEYMTGMFSNCQSLTSLDLTHFITSKVVSMSYMFYNCKSLTSLDLSNFEISRVKYLGSMFNNCINLEYINIYNFKNFINNSEHDKIFFSISDNAVICIKDNINEIRELIKDNKCNIIDCSADKILKQQKVIIDKNNTCINNCYNDDEYKYEYNGKCYKNCPYGYIIDDNNQKKCKCELEQCLYCSNVAISFGLCNKCNYNYYQKENGNKNIGIYINCYNDSILKEGYYLDINDSLYKKCYDTCKTCEIKGDGITHNCLRCKSNYYFHIVNNSNYGNCYLNCNYYYYNDNNNFVCTSNYSCPNEYNKLIPKKNKCIKNCNEDDIYIYEYNNTCNDIHEIICSKKEPFEIKGAKECKEVCSIYDLLLNNCVLKYKENGENILLDSIEKELISGYNTSNIDNGNNEVINYEKIMITLTTLQNQKNNIISDTNMTIIDFSECEIELKKFYNLSNNKIIYMKKIDIFQDGYKIPKIFYEVYSKLNSSNLIKLNLSICSNKIIDIYIPINIKDNLDILNSSSKYYNDICYPAISDSGADIIIKDRRNEYINKNRTVCQDDCDFSEYNTKILKAKCSCKVKESPSSYIDIFIDKKKLLKNFIKIKNVVNMRILKCYQQIFTREGITYNIGFYIIFLLIIFHIISIFIFYFKQINEFKNKINALIDSIKNNENNMSEKQEPRKTYIKNTNNKKKYKICNKNKYSTNLNKENNIQQKTRNQKMNSNNNINCLSIQPNDDKKNETLITTQINNGSSNKLKLKSMNIKIIKNNKINNYIDYTDEEMNELSYDLALKFDKRTYFIYYFSLLRTKHIFISTFFNNNDYNIKIIKYDLFFISFAIYYAVNAPFFNDDLLHKIYEDKGSFNLLYQLPQIIYSSLISTCLNILLKLLSLSKDDIINFKKIVQI